MTTGAARLVMAALAVTVGGCGPAEDPQGARCDEARDIFEQLSEDTGGSIDRLEELNNEMRYESRYSREGQVLYEERATLMRPLGDLILRIDTLIEQNEECFTVQERFDARTFADAVREARAGQP